MGDPGRIRIGPVLFLASLAVAGVLAWTRLPAPSDDAGAPPLATDPGAPALADNPGDVGSVESTDSAVLHEGDGHRTETPQRRLALEIHAALGTGPLELVCPPRASDLGRLLAMSKDGGRMQSWATGRIRSCEGALMRHGGLTSVALREFVEAILAAAPDDPDALWRASVTSLLNGDHERAVGQLRHALERRDDVKYAMDLGQALASRAEPGDHEQMLEARALLARAAAEGPIHRRAEFAVRVGEVDLELGRTETARTTAMNVLQALDAEPDQFDLDPYHMLTAAALLFHAGDRELGEAYLERAVQLARDERERAWLDNDRTRILSGERLRRSYVGG